MARLRAWISASVTGFDGDDFFFGFGDAVADILQRGLQFLLFALQAGDSGGAGFDAELCQGDAAGFIVQRFLLSGGGGFTHFRAHTHQLDFPFFEFFFNFLQFFLGGAAFVLREFHLLLELLHIAGVGLQARLKAGDGFRGSGRESGCQGTRTEQNAKSAEQEKIQSHGGTFISL
jgi:hypothetical protein